jgi:drug/metabolite transporter (DMT)-like permease
MPPALGVFTLVLITVIWGTTFVVVKEALQTIPVPLLLALRFSLAALLLAWVVPERRTLVPALILGLLAFAGFATQTLGLAITSASNAAFITGLSVILTPMASAVWFKNRVPARAFIAAMLALAGLGLMTLTSATGVNSGDLWVLGTAFTYAFYIVYLGEVANRHSALALSSMQLWPMAILAWIWAVPELPVLRTVPTPTLLAILYLAVVATALTTVMQTYAQRVVPAYLAALIFVLEPVFAALFAYLMLNEILGWWGWVGGALVVLAMIVSEFRFKRRQITPVGEPAHSPGELPSGAMPEPSQGGRSAETEQHAEEVGAKPTSR